MLVRICSLRCTKRTKLSRYGLAGDGRWVWECKDSEKRIASDEVRRVNASGKRDCISSKAKYSLRRSVAAVRRRPRSHDKRNNVDRVKSDAEQDDSDCAHDSPVRRKSSDESVLTTVVFLLIAPQTQMQANMTVHIMIDLMLLVVHRILGVNMCLPTLTVCIQCESKIPPLGDQIFFSFFSQMVENLQSIFYTPIKRSYLP